MNINRFQAKSKICCQLKAFLNSHHGFKALPDVFQHPTSSKIGSNDTQSSTSVLKIKLGNIVVMSLQMSSHKHRMSDGLSQYRFRSAKAHSDPYVPHLSSYLEKALNPILVRSLCKIKEVNLKREIKKHPFKHENFTSFHRCSVLTRINAGFKHNNHYQTDENQCRWMLSKIVS